MSRNAPPPPLIPRRGSPWTSHLRQTSRSSADQPHPTFEGPRSPDTVSSHSTIRDAQPQRRFLNRVCTVTINESINQDDILLNLDLLGGAVKPGTLMSIAACKPDPERPQPGGIFGTSRSISFQRLRDAENASARNNSNPEVDVDRKYIFVAKDMSKQMKASQSNVEIYVAKHIGDAFNLRRGTQVVLAPVDENTPAIEASHVELTFKDMYMTRADMWRLAVNDLAERTVYKGQVVYFMGTLKAVVSTVFVDGRKVHSAFFGKETRPVFRSESARYVLFIQMAREMWDFDADGSGEVLFYKVVNGFLPALFKKWALMQVKHLVSIVLFARVEYDVGITADLANTSMHDYYTGYQSTGNKRPYKDFYRVVVSEMSSGEWTTILRTLKREHNNFRRDISIHHEDITNLATGFPEDANAKGPSGSRIRAESSLAMHGNFLEAINLASSVYSRDHIDRDLLRTGISVVVISPGSGVFEVEHEALRRSTESLISNGIGIDLICIGSIPLHSVPLFRYRNPRFNVRDHRPRARSLRSKDSTPTQPTPLAGSYNTLSGSISPTKAGDSSNRHAVVGARLHSEEWAFAIPQWLHISYWTGKTEGALSYQGIALTTTGHDIAGSDEEFAVRCRLYDLQMRSVLDTNEIEVPQLHLDPAFPNIAGTLDRDRERRARGTSTPVQHGHVAAKQYEALLEHVYGFQKFNAERMSKSAEASLWKKLQQFDESRARLPSSRATTERLKVYADMDENTRKRLSEDAGLFGTSVGGRRPDIPIVNLSSSVASSTASRSGLSGSMERSSSETLSLYRPSARRDSTATIQSNKQLVPRTPKFIRQISLGQRGFGIAAPKAAIAELKTETVNATPTSDRLVKSPSTATLSSMTTAPGTQSPKIKPTANEPSHTGSGLANQIDGSNSGIPSRPILIKNSVSAIDPARTLRSNAEPALARSARPDDKDIRSSSVLRAEDDQKMVYSKLRAGGLPELPSTLSPTTALAPWLVVLNPSNPEANKVDDSVLFSRWQHVFPRPSEMSVMKWKSLSSPAAVPLTTEYFPAKEQFDTEYQRQPYTVSQNLDDEYGDEIRSREDLLRELINARFAHGFQVVVGPSVAKAFGQKTVKAADLLSRAKPLDDGTNIFMSIGNTIHQLSCANGTEVDINIYTRKPTSSSHSSDAYRVYKPAIRTLFDPAYTTSEREIWVPQSDRNWNFIDSFLAGHSEEMTENLRFWRARFVLIPLSPHTAQKEPRDAHGVDDEEEVRLEGIRKLSQLWLKHRYLSPSERQFQSGGDPNPLDIVFNTEDTSTVIASELESLHLFENADPSSRKPHLVSSKERFSKTNFNLTNLAEAIQQPIESGGLRMQTRRWHLQRYTNCFIGSEMTTWLLTNFEDLENREEAVQLGNSLMCRDNDRSNSKDKDIFKDVKRDRDRGIFVHVDKRHDFRDGQYFYRIVSEFAKPGIPGWFNSRKKDNSVPATPTAENMPNQTPRLGFADRPGSVRDPGSPRSDATTPTLLSFSGRKPRVILSKMIKYDVDPRRRSYRPERVNLHYDRLHNPDTCYHIRLDWMNVTAKLIEDTIKIWAGVAEKHGMRLVELPISEACKISEINPFRRAVHVRLALAPPTQRPATFYYPNTTTPQQQPGKHYYQRALLRRFDYVLDYEAASAFPSNVGVSYSWGVPDYKYAQYIHRSGMLLAQVTDNGDFYLAANRLYSNRTTSQKEGHARGGQDSHSSGAPPPTNDRVAQLLHSSTHNVGNSSMRIGEGTPISSPMFRPVLFASPMNRAQQYADMSSASGAPATSGAAAGGSGFHNFPGMKPLPTLFGHADMTAESRINELASFCADERQLEAFYRETLEHGTMATPASVPATIPEEDGSISDGGSGRNSISNHGVADAHIPALGLPPGVLDYGGGSVGGGFGGGGGGLLLGGGEVLLGSSGGPKVGTPNSLSSGEPRSLFLRRASVQYN
ncbi:SEA/GATOR complex protein SEA1/DEPDC5 [Microdochium nivale]|nr:SEA/GATOR complex protein SEA1/DEPDC5 [Microdochium nivale]